MKNLGIFNFKHCAQDQRFHLQKKNALKNAFKHFPIKTSAVEMPCV